MLWSLQRDDNHPAADGSVDSLFFFLGEPLTAHLPKRHGSIQRPHSDAHRLAKTTAWAQCFELGQPKGKLRNSGIASAEGTQFS